MSQTTQTSQQQSSSKKSQDPTPADFTMCEIDDGKLLLLDAIGSGAYGRVYRAIDSVKRDKHHKFAVKCLRKFDKHSRDHHFQMREFVLHKKVTSHPNIVKFYDAFTEHDHVFVVLELCDGGDLFTAIIDHHLFDKNEKLIKSCFAQILDGVHYCHKNSVFHRDLKPENILCSKDGKHFRLADFGLATDQPLSYSYGCGSREYMSPECIGKEFGLGRKPYSTLLNDIWALGVILINIITARSPWSQAITSDPMFKSYIRSPLWLIESLPISSSLFALVMQMLQPLPSLRMDSIPDIRCQLLALDALYAPPEMHEETLIPISSPAASREAQPGVDAIASREESADWHSIVARLDACIDSNDDCESLFSSDSDTESVGPITPETFPVHPELEVPDIAEDEDIEATKPETVKSLANVKLKNVVDPSSPLLRPARPVPPSDTPSVRLVRAKPNMADTDAGVNTRAFGLGAVEVAQVEAEALGAISSKVVAHELTGPVPCSAATIHQSLPVRAEPRCDAGGRVGGRVANIVKALEGLCASSSQKGSAGPAGKPDLVKQNVMGDAATVDQRGQQEHERSVVRKLIPKVNIRARLNDLSLL